MKKQVIIEKTDLDFLVSLINRATLQGAEVGMFSNVARAIMGATDVKPEEESEVVVEEVK